MLWFKGWLETRFRLLYMVAFTLFYFFVMHSIGTRTRDVKAAIFGASSPAITGAVVMICVFLAGAGIATQPSLQASKGLHGSTLFTLSMPISRLRLLAVRACIGWLESAAVIGFLCWGIWFAMPLLRKEVTPTEIFEQAATLIACSSTIYSLSVLLGTVLDDQWRTWGTLLASAGIWLLCAQLSLPAFIDIFHGMENRSPIVTHELPWNVMAFSIGLAAVLFFAALKVAQKREY